MTPSKPTALGLTKDKAVHFLTKGIQVKRTFNPRESRMREVIAAV